MQLSDKERKLQGHRKRMTLLSMANWLGQSGVVGLFAWSGAADWQLALAFFGVTMGLNLVFYVWIVSNRNLRLADPGMLMAQLLSAFVVQLGFLALMPSLWVVFLISLLVTYNFTMLGFTPRQHTLTWVVLCLGLGLAFIVGGTKYRLPEPSLLTSALFWVMFAVALKRVSVIGAQFSLLRGQLSKKNQLLSESLERIERLASHDDLTGAYNRRAFMHLVEEERERSARTGQQFCVAMFDLDHFKSINDRFGHATGDEVLRRFADAVRAGMRTTDRFGRYGGEEFALLLTATTTSEVGLVAVQRICSGVAAVDWSDLGAGLAVTVSAGIACHRDAESGDALLDRADQALYQAKRAGRDRTLLAA